MLARNLRIEADLIDHLFNSSEKRLARTLLLLARYGRTNHPAALPKVSQETLAEMIGATRSRVNFFMNKFRKLGLHRIQRRPEDPQLSPERRPARLTGLGFLYQRRWGAGFLGGRPRAMSRPRAGPSPPAHNERIVGRGWNGIEVPDVHRDVEMGGLVHGSKRQGRRQHDRLATPGRRHGDAGFPWPSSGGCCASGRTSTRGCCTPISSKRRDSSSTPPPTSGRPWRSRSGFCRTSWCWRWKDRRRSRCTLDWRPSRAPSTSRSLY